MSTESVSATASSNLYEQCVSKSLKRQERYAENIIVTRLPDLIPSQIPPKVRVFEGVYSQSWQPYKEFGGKRFLRLDSIVYPTLINDPRLSHTSHIELARDYLIAKYGKTKERKIKSDNNRALGKFPQPLLALVGTYENHSYVDVRSAYYSIMCLAGWDVEFWPNKWLGIGRAPDDFFLQGGDALSKAARNAMHGMSLPSKMVFYTNKGQQVRDAHSDTLNMRLHNVIARVMHGIAWEAYRRGAKYINTDGYILPSNLVPSMMDAINKWGLSAKHEEWGTARVKGVGVYSLGRKYSRKKIDKPRSYNNLIEFSDREWFERTWKKVVQFRKPDIKNIITR